MKSRLQLTDIRLAWDLIGPHVQKLKNEWSLDWRPEDVYASCLAGYSFCWLCEDGFVIVSPQENRFTLQKELFVWICIGWQGKHLLDEYYDDICSVARDVGATSILFESPREGFRRVAERKHWEAMTTYKLEVKHALDH